MKKLLTEWRRFLNEQVDISKLGLYEDKTEKEITMVLYDIDEFSKYLNKYPQSHINYVSMLYDTQTFIGMLGAGKNKYDEPCMGAYIIYGTGVMKQYQGQKFGRMLYGLAMVSVYPEGLTPDRASVSNKAKNVWNSLEKNPKIEKLPSDKKPFTGTFDDPFDKKTSPEEDDCTIHYDSWADRSRSDSSLNKAYKYTSGTNEKLLHQLKKNHEAFMLKIYNDWGHNKIMWKDVANAIFSKVYRNG